MSNDLASACGLDPFTWLLPGTPVDHQTGPGRPAPFAPPPLQGLHRYYEAVRLPAAHQYSAPCSSSCLEPSLPPTGLNTPIGSIAARGSHVPHQRLNRARATFMPDTAWPGPQAPARLIPRQATDPGFDAVHTLSALQQWFTRVRLLGSHLTQHVRLFRSAHHPGSFTRAARGGFGPPPA